MRITGSASTTWNAKSLPGGSSSLTVEHRHEARTPDYRVPNQPGKTDPDCDNTERHHSAIKCRACAHLVTSEQFRIEIAGQHGHQVTNPNGIAFVIGCFNQVDGCLAAGQPYWLHSWFQGYQWQIALCRHCGAHLGWYFSQAGKSSFYALILNRVTD